MELTSPKTRFSNSRFFIALLLSLIMLSAPLAPVMALPSAASSAADAAKTPKLFAGATAQVGVESSRNLRMPRPLVAPFQAPTGITATKEDSFSDPNNDGKAKPGDTITYTIVITNNAATDAANVVFTDQIDAQTTLVSGSIQTTPVARTDNYAVAGNIQRSITATNEGVLANDSDPDGTGTLTVTSTGAQTTTQGGNLTLNADGTFTYNPPAGFDGTDTFTYTVSDGTSTNTGKINFNISGMIWFIDNSQAVNGDGRLTTPFNNLASFASINDGAGNHPAANDNIFLYRQSASDYTGGTPLLSGQRLIGQGATAPLSTITGITPPPGSAPLPSTGGTNPVIVNSAGNDVTIVAASAGNTIRGVNLGNATGSAIATGAGFGNLSISEANISTTGQALNLNTGTLAATLGALTSGGGLNNINLNSVNGSLTASSGSLSGSSSTALNIAGGNATIAYPGNITNSAAPRVISAINVTGGSLTVSGTVTSGGSAGNDAIVIDGNDTNAYTVSINAVSINTNSMDDGILLADLPAGSSVTITSGSVTSQGAGRRVLAFETAAGVAENTAGTYNFSGVDFNNNNGDGMVFGSGQTGTYSFRDYIVNAPNAGTGGTGLTVNGGSPAITFRRIDQNGGTNGINVSNNTGGSFTVNGTGTTDGSGGTIQNVSARGASFATANNITLKNMNFVSTGTTDGAAGTCGADNTGNTGCNGAIHLQAANTVTLDNIDTNGGQYGVNGNDVTAFNLTNANILNHGNGANEHGIRFINLKGTSAINSVAVNNSFTDNLRVYNTVGTLTLTLKNSSFNNTNGTSGNAGVNLITDTTANMTVNVQGSTFDNNRTVGLLGTFQGTSTANITVTTNPDNASDRSLFNSNNEGIDLGAQGSANMTFNINNSDFLFNDAQAMNLLTGVDATASCDVNGTIANNAIGNGTADSGSTGGQGIRLDFRGNADAALTITNNNIQNTDQQGIQVLNRLSGDTPGGAGCAAANCGLLALTVTNNTVGVPDNNTAFPTGNVHGMFFSSEDKRSLCLDISGNTSTGQGAGGTGIRTRQADTAIFQLEGFSGTGTNSAHVVDHLDSPRNNATASVQTSGTGTVVNYTTSGGCATTVANDGQGNPGDFDARNIQEAPVKVAPAASVAETRTASSSKSSDEAKATARSIADVIARASRRTEQPTEEVELASANLAASNFAAAVRLAPSVAGITDAGTGRRRSSNVKAREQKALATTSAALFAGETVTRNIGTLSAGASVTITFQVTVNDPFTGSTDQVSNQGEVTSSFPTVQTQNKDGNTVTGGATITPIEAPPDITINPATVVEPQSGSTDASFTVSLSRAATSTVTVNFQTEDGTATVADGDYTATNGTLTFTNGQRVQTISVPVLHNISANGEPEPDETFKVKLTGTAGGRIQPSPADEATGTITAVATPAPVVISEFRSAGPNGTGDEFIELYNNTNAVSVDISGWSIVQLTPGDCAATPVIIATIPANTILQPRKHYLLVGSGYAAGTLNSYAAPEPGAPTLSPSLDDGASIGLFKTATIEGLTSDNRVDAVGFISNSSSNNCSLLREGSPLSSPAGSGSNSDYSFTRVPSDKLQDTDNNSNDFIIVSTTPTTPVGNNATPIQGSPAPENTSSPVWKSITEIDSALIDPNAAQSSSPNRHIVRTPYTDTLTPSGPTGIGSQYVSTMSVQRRYFNNTGQTITRLRIRVIDMTTTNVPNIYAPSSQVDLRLLSSDGVTRAPSGFPNLKGLTLDRAANQPRGGGINSSATAGTITISPLPPNDDPNTPNVIENAVDLQMLLGYTGSGKFRFFIIVEALPY